MNLKKHRPILVLGVMVSYSNALMHFTLVLMARTLV